MPKLTNSMRSTIRAKIYVLHEIERRRRKARETLRARIEELAPSAARAAVERFGAEKFTMCGVHIRCVSVYVPSIYAPSREQLEADNLLASRLGGAYPEKVANCARRAQVAIFGYTRWAKFTTTASLLKAHPELAPIVECTLSGRPLAPELVEKTRRALLRAGWPLTLAKTLDNAK